jgi:hypothetical protein
VHTSHPPLRAIGPPQSRQKARPQWVQSQWLVCAVSGVPHRQVIRVVVAGTARNAMGADSLPINVDPILRPPDVAFRFDGHILRAVTRPTRGRGIPASFIYTAYTVQMFSCQAGLGEEELQSDTGLGKLLADNTKRFDSAHRKQVSRGSGKGGHH